MIKNNTPIEEYEFNKIPISVKREDLCAPDGAPPFSKIRGLYQYLTQLKEKGINTVGYTETSISMAGWGVAWVCNMLKMKAVIFNPIYKETPPTLEIHRRHWIENKAEIIDIKAGMAKVNWYISKQTLEKEFGSNSLLLPLGLPLYTTIVATTEEVKRHEEFNSVVVNIGSGTICAGLYRGLPHRSHLYGIMGRIGKIQNKRKKILSSLGVFNLFAPQLTIIDPGYLYTESVDVSIPFPCNKFYDAKAWVWLLEHIKELKQPILFWNIGANSK